MRKLATAVLLMICALPLTLKAQEKAPRGASAPAVCVLRQPFPKHIFVQRGTIVRFAGTLPDGFSDINFSIKSGGEIRATSTSHDKWAVEWNPAHQPETRCHLQLVVAAGNRAEIDADVAVDILDGTPFKITAPKPNTIAIKTVEVEVQQTGSLSADSYEILLDDAPTGAPLDTGGKGRLDLSKLRPGKRQVSVLIRSAGGEIKTDAITIEIPSKIQIQPFAAGNAFNAQPSSISVQIDPGIKTKDVEFFVDDRSIGISSASPFGDIVLHPEKLAPGKHILSSALHDETGAQFLSPEFQFTVDHGPKLPVNAHLPLSGINGLPLEFEPWDQAVLDELDTVLLSEAKLSRLILRLRDDEHVLEDSYSAAKDLVIIQQYATTDFKKLQIPKSVPPADHAKLQEAINYILDGLRSEARLSSKMYDFMAMGHAQGATSITEIGHNGHPTRLPGGDTFSAALEYARSEQNDVQTAFAQASKSLRDVEKDYQISRGKHEKPL